MAGRWFASDSRWFAPIALFLLTVLAAVLRFWGLDRIPPGFHYDEAYEALEAWRVLTQPGYRPIFFAGNFGVEPLFIYLTSLAFRLFGETPTVMRGVAAVIGTLTVPALYALGRELVRSDDRMPPAMPLLAAASLAIMRWHIHYSRVGIEPVLVPFFLVLTWWALWRSVRLNRRRDWVSLGVLGSLSLYSYQVAWLLPLLMVGLLALLWLAPFDFAQNKEQRRLQGRWGGLALAVVVAIGLSLPLGIHLWQHPAHLFLRTSQITVGAEGAGAGTPSANLLATLAMFNLRGDLDPRNNVPGLPVLDPLMSVPFLLAVGAALWRWRRPAFGGLLLAGAIMLLPTVLSEYAPHFRRALGAVPAVALLCGLGLALLLGRWSAGPKADATNQPSAPRPLGQPAEVPWRLRQSGLAPDQLTAGMAALQRAGRAIVVAVILFGSAILSSTAYFENWGRSQAIYYAYDQGLWEIGEYVRGLPPGERIYLTPRPATDMTLAFAWRNGPAVRHFDGRSAFVAPAFASPGPATYIVIEHEDFRGGRLLRELYSQATEVKTFFDRAGKVYARAYRIPDTSIPNLARQPRYPFAASWLDMALLGYDLDKSVYRPGEIVYLQLWWRATAVVEGEWTVFTHILGPGKAGSIILWAGRDARPGQGSAPTTAWQPGDLILDEYQLQLAPDIPPGEYQIEVGLYDPAAGGARRLATMPVGVDHLILGTIRVQ